MREILRELRFQSASDGGRDGQPLFMGVDDEAAPPKEAHQRHPKFPGELYGQAGRSRYRCEQRYPGSNGLLNDLKSAASAHEEYVAAERPAAIEKRPADHLVHRVVSA